MDKLNGVSMGAHRAAWIRVNGAIPTGLVVCHKCDNGLCVNVNHMFLGTMSDNMQDCLQKGRLKTNLGDQRGQNNNNAKPDLIQRNLSIRLDRALGLSWKALRLKYGIKSNGHLSKILND